MERRICRGRTEEDRWTARRPWRWGWAVGPALGMARTGWRPRRRGRPFVWVAVGSRAGFPGCPAVSRGFSGPRKALLCVLADPSPPLPALLRAPRVRPPAFPSAVGPRAGLASRRCRPPASVRRWRSPGGALEALRKGAGREPGTAGLRVARGHGGRRYAAGERSPWPAAALVSRWRWREPRERAPVCRPRCAGRAAPVLGGLWR